MVDWSEQMAGVDLTAEEELGDEFQLSIAGGPLDIVKGWAYPPGAEAEIGFAPIDPMLGKPRVKLGKHILAVPSSADRLKVPQLADPLTTTFRPENWTSVDAGRYWLIDLQEALL
jgi:hypothetical protein